VEGRHARLLLFTHSCFLRSGQGRRGQVGLGYLFGVNGTCHHRITETYPKLRESYSADVRSPVIAELTTSRTHRLEKVGRQIGHDSTDQVIVVAHRSDVKNLALGS
jgi:hypothetical protein